MTASSHTVRVVTDEGEHLLTVEDGTNLRRALLEAGISPYAPLTERLNCGGRGLCATCGVWVEAGEPAPTHWHDAAAAAFGYPRLTCQMTVNAPMTIRLVSGKVVWGGRDPARARLGRGSDQQGQKP